MVVLNIYGKISPICISKKLGLYIDNLPNDIDNNWNEELYNEITTAAKNINSNYKKHKLGQGFEVKKFYSEICNSESMENISNSQMMHEIVNNMICIYMDYEYDDMPLGGWERNCFDSRLCELDYAEKIINFINKIDDRGNVPVCIYSTNNDFNNPYKFLWYTPNICENINTLMYWGKVFDSFLKDKNDFLELDYIINSFFKDNEYNEYHFLKLYSLCQLFLEKEKESELDKKLMLFLDDVYSNEVKSIISQKLRKMRNKIAHGDFIAFEKLVEEYACEIMDGNFSFDYSEYSRKNWVILHICCDLENAVIKMINMLFFNKDKLNNIKNGINEVL